MITVLVPTWHRPASLIPLVRNITETTRTGAQVVIIAEADDEPTFALAADLAPALMVANTRKRNFAGATNTGYASATGDYIFTGSDDLRFYDGWDEAALAALEADPVLRVAGTNDLGNPGVLAGLTSTSHLIDRRYIDEVGAVAGQPPGMVVCEDYGHEYTDTELVATAKARGVFAPCLASIVEHRHTIFGKAPWDETYARTRAASAGDGAIFESRRHLWENLPLPRFETVSRNP